MTNTSPHLSICLITALVGNAPVVPAVANAAELNLPSIVERDVALFVEQLGADSRQLRLRSEQQLLKLGPDILPLLPAVEQLPSVSAREAVRRIRTELELRKARESLLAGRITLKGAFPLDHILRELVEQTDNPVDSTGLPAEIREGRMAVDFDQRPFWSALDEVRRRTDPSFLVRTGSGCLVLVQQPAGAGAQPSAVAYSGPFRIAARLSNPRSLPNDDANQLLPVHFEIQAEPRLRPLFLKYAEADFSGATAEAALLRPYNPDARSDLPLGDGNRTLLFLAPTLKPLGPIRLSGRFGVLTAAGTEVLTFAGLARGVTQRRGAVTVGIKNVTFPEKGNGAGQTRVRVSVSYNSGGPAFESHRLWILRNRVYLLGTEDRRFEYNGLSTELQTDGAVVVEYRFEGLKKMPKEYSFVYEAPTLIVNAPVEFEILQIQYGGP